MMNTPPHIHTHTGLPVSSAVLAAGQDQGPDCDSAEAAACVPCAGWLQCWDDLTEHAEARGANAPEQSQLPCIHPAETSAPENKTAILGF